MKKPKSRKSTIDFRDEAKKWNRLREENPGAYTQSGWAKIAMSYRCTYANYVAKALTESIFFLGDGSDKHPEYLFTKPVTLVFIQRVIEDQKKKRVATDTPSLKDDKITDAVSEGRRSVDILYLMQSVELGWSRVITQGEFDGIRLVADVWKDKHLNEIYICNRGEFTITVMKD